MVELQAWQGVDGRAGGDQDVLRFELLLAVFGLHLYLLGFDEAAYTVVDGDLVLLHQALHAAPELGDDLFATLRRLGVVELYLADLDPVVFAAFDVVQQMGRLEQCFGRDAAHVQACPSEMPALPLLDEGYAHTQLAGPDRRYVSTVPAADYHEVEVLRHLLAPFVLGLKLQVVRNESSRQRLSLFARPCNGLGRIASHSWPSTVSLYPETFTPILTARLPPNHLPAGRRDRSETVARLLFP